MQSKPTPELVLKEWINFKPLDLDSLKGKIVVLDFWATWCRPCLSSVSHTNKMKKKYAKKGVVIIGVCNQRGAEKMGVTLKKNGIEYPVAVDGETNASYKVSSYLDYYIIYRQGILRWADVANNDMEKAIEILLREQLGKGKNSSSALGDGKPVVFPRLRKGGWRAWIISQSYGGRGTGIFTGGAKQAPQVAQAFGREVASAHSG